MMGGLGPWEPQPLVAVAVSGGADSMAACLLSRDWARARGGDVLAFVVDHGIRHESKAEAALTCDRLTSAGVPAMLIRLDGLGTGPGIAARARAARHEALEAACAERGILHLVFGHHARDQAETVVMRMLAQSHAPGLAGMAAMVETARVRKLRPLLGVVPARLWAILAERGVAWVEDPTNADPSQQRARLRMLRADPHGNASSTRALVEASARRGVARAAMEVELAAELACRVTIDPHGFAVVTPGAMRVEALAALIGMISGGMRPPAVSQVAGLAADLRPATLGGVRVMPAGRMGDGWLMAREWAACAPPVEARPGAVWDGRFRLTDLPNGTSPGSRVTLGAWGMDAISDRNGPPVAVLRGLPVLRDGTELLNASHPCMLFAPRLAATGARFAGVC